MCIFNTPSSSAPPPPKAVALPEAPRIPDISAAKITQSAPAVPTAPVFKRRGKAGMVIQLGSAPGTNLPGA